MRKQLGFVWLSCIAALAVGCGDDSGGGPSDGGPDGIVIDGDNGGGDGGDGDGGGFDGGEGMCFTGLPCPSGECRSGHECFGGFMFELEGAIRGADAAVAEEDGGVADGGVADGGVADGGVADGGVADGGVMDGGAADGGGLIDGGGTDLPSESVAISQFNDGYCVPVAPSADNNGEGCSLSDSSTCNDCSTCSVLPYFGATACLADCTPNGADNSSCRNGYACNTFDPVLGTLNDVCFPGCSNDDECRLELADADGDGEAELAYDPELDATCNPDTSRCEHTGTEGAVAGDTCQFKGDCESDGYCLSEEVFGWRDGFCTKFACDLDGRECAGDDGIVCQSRGFGIASCLPSCTVAAEADSDERIGPDGHGEGCRPGYKCHWNGSDPTGAPDNGACIDGNYNDVDVNNVGGGCEENADCYSPFGQGLCFSEDGFGFPGGYCTIAECGNAGIPEDVCGEDAACVTFNAEASITRCLQTCEEADDCRSGYGCVEISGDGDRACFPSCGDDDDCPGDETCDKADPEDDFGLCSGMDMPLPDGGMPDAGMVDAGMDAGADAGPDAGADSGADAGPDASE